MCVVDGSWRAPPSLISLVVPITVCSEVIEWVGHCLVCSRVQQLDELPMKVRGLFSQNTQEQYEATQWFRKLLSIGK